MQGKTATIVEENLSKVIEELGYDLYEVEFVKKQNGMNLTLFITSPDHPITLKDCELVHRTVDPILDELDPTNGAGYYLNVSSVGLDKPIKSDKDFKRCLNTEIVVKQFATKDNVNKEIIGTLKSFDEVQIVVEVNNASITILRQNIAVCKPNVKI
ncbi:MAG: ribosome maturation factor RimP [Clostridia bacterium]|nr:ribosome maturation factor RimP [Clostridia bacterium]